MTWIPAKIGPKVGERAILIRDISVMSGMMKKDTAVTITGIDDQRGYAMEDDEGHTVNDCGWNCVRRAQPGEAGTAPYVEPGSIGTIRNGVLKFPKDSKR